MISKLTRPQVTQTQALAISAYNVAQAEFAVELLTLNGLTEAQATQALAMGYDIINGEESE